ncbi:hypothetical protein COY26_04345 [Candidatus Woesearchaeota archaeon CG_4_10_14_0_2_um_filter_33_10]|nr:MAG: hypothetical protein AUJ83_04120 [Candidatus Woesearchaeota archaeon CG1_02_33_12]PIZ52574.1 MAG: hypothetical protein COY26_04345 [Candidatus Woesearchaeota archaeon CG_4_10_14_0_2_um_filter_33_10]
MVKGFIKGLISSKSNEEKKQKEEIPDELPPLAEDVSKEEQEKARLEAEEQAKEEELKEEIPEELTPIDENSVEEKPEEIDRLKEEFEDVGSKKQSTGFFSNLLNITKKQGLNKKLLEKDLYKGMQEYHSLKPSVDIKSITKKELEDDIAAKLDELKLLEKNWQKQKEFIEENKQILLADEKKIQDKIEELKLLLRKISFYKDAPVGKYFESKDGVIVKNVFELLNLLKITDESVFKHHTAENRNDFALWIKEVIGDKELAAKLNKSGSKKEIISILEDASAGKS